MKKIMYNLMLLQVYFHGGGHGGKVNRIGKGRVQWSK